MRRVNVIGVGMTKFTSPKDLWPYTEMGIEDGDNTYGGRVVTNLQDVCFPRDILWVQPA